MFITGANQALDLEVSDTFSDICIDDVKLNRFLIGRQIFVVFTVFLAAQLTTFPNMQQWFGTSEKVPYWFMVSMLDTGLLGAVVVVVFGQLVRWKYSVNSLLVATTSVILLSCKIFELTGVLLCMQSLYVH